MDDREDLPTVPVAVAEGDIGRARKRNPRGMQPQPPIRAVPERPSLRTQRTDLPVRVSLLQ